MNHNPLLNVNKDDKIYKFLLVISLFLIGFYCVGSCYSYLILLWKEQTLKISNMITLICFVAFFIALLSLKIKNSVTITFSRCIALIGAILIFYSFVYWKIGENQNVGFQLFYLGKNTNFYINGWYLMIGITALLFSRINYYGLKNIK